MKDRYRLRCAVFLILTRKENNEEYILLQQRYNTGLLDGKYDVSCSGHLEENESSISAIIREAKEEIGIEIKKEDLKLLSTMHTNFNDSGEYIFLIFTTDKYKGTPTIMEKDKCDDLNWFNIKSLPKNLINTRKIMIDNYLNNSNYSEYGFTK